MSEYEISIKAPDGFSLRATSLSHGWHECTPMAWSDGGQCLQLVERVGKTACLLAVKEETRRSKGNRLTLTLCAGQADDLDWADLAKRAERSLGLDQDLTEFYALCAKHPMRHDKLEIDSATIAHVARTHTNGRRPTHKQIERIYAPYGKWRNLVYWCENWLQWDTAKRIVASSRRRRSGG